MLYKLGESKGKDNAPLVHSLAIITIYCCIGVHSLFSGNSFTSRFPRYANGNTSVQFCYGTLQILIMLVIFSSLIVA